MKKLFLPLFIFPLIGFGQQSVQQIDSIVQSKFNNGPAVSVLVSQEFRPIYSQVKGLSNMELKLQATEHTRFRIGSVTKQFTAIAILQLMEEGKLSIKDPIQKFLINFPKKEYPLTIEHLLTHTSGLAEITELEVFEKDLMQNGCDPDSLVNYFKDLPLEFEPGSQFSYCNSGYHLLGLIIEQVSGEDYNQYISNHLLSPAGMTHTLADRTDSIIDRRAMGYEEVDGRIQKATFIDMSIPFSAGNLLSTANDLNKWYQALFEYKLVSKQTLQSAHTPFRLNDGSYSNYGYGWFVDSLQGEKLISHEGGINGFLSSAWFIPFSKTLTIILSNCLCSPTTQTAKSLTAIAIGKPLPIKKRIKLPEDLLQTYTGVYLMNGEEWTISMQDGELYFRFSNGNGHPIYPLSKNEFFAEEWDTQFLFFEKDGTVEFHFVYLGEIVRGIGSECTFMVIDLGDFPSEDSY
ncbi:serine hydrolase [bacterium SCSIO 12741]|nr:serine hydrolase [bacterium SCSIO 12741]